MSSTRQGRTRSGLAFGVASKGPALVLPGPYTVERSAADVVELLDPLALPAAALLGYSAGCGEPGTNLGHEVLRLPSAI